MAESVYRHIQIKTGWLSMCTACFLATARATSESELVAGEKEHRCPGAFFRPQRDQRSNAESASSIMSRPS